MIRNPHTRARARAVLAAAGALFLLAHGAIHLWWLAPPADAADLVDPEGAWVVERGMSAQALRAATLVLAPAVFLLYAVAAVGTLGFLVGPAAWRRSVLAASGLSLVLLTLYFDPQGWVGFVVDAALVAAFLTPVPGRLGLPRARGAAA